MISILNGDWIEVLKTLTGQSVQCCVTSPPYWGLRDYGTAKWEGGDAQCDHSRFLAGNGDASAKQVTSEGTQKYQYRDVCEKCGAKRIDRQLGLEKTPEEYVAKIVAGFQEVKRVLRDDGTLWLNIGDCYGGYYGDRYAHKPFGDDRTADASTPPNKPSQGKMAKQLQGIPWRVAFALQADGWYLRSDIIWHKPNPMPESVTDRPTKAHEYIFLLSKSQRYFYDAEAISETLTRPDEAYRRTPARFGGANKFEEAFKQSRLHSGNEYTGTENGTRNKRSVWAVATSPYKESHFATFPPKLIEPCILAGSRVGDTVLDPFGGSGTTGMVAEENGRNSIMIELNPKYIELAQKRTRYTIPIPKQTSLWDTQNFSVPS